MRRIQEQKRSSLARQVYEEQVKHSWPGLAKEVKDICYEVKIPDVNHNRVTKEEIKEAIFWNHYKNMKVELGKFSKLENIKNEDFRSEQNYLKGKSVDNIRREFRLRTQLVATFRDNYRNKYRTLPRGEEDEDPGLQCGDCRGARDTQAHCLVCPAWQVAREGLTLTLAEDMVVYYRKVLEGREKREEEERVKRRKEREEEARGREEQRRGVKRMRG